jgi:hypothetical protein
MQAQGAFREGDGKAVDDFREDDDRGKVLEIEVKRAGRENRYPFRSVGRLITV